MNQRQKPFGLLPVFPLMTCVLDRVSLNGSWLTMDAELRVRLALLANKLCVELYGREPKKVCSSTKPEWRNEVGKYPCGGLKDLSLRTLSETQHVDGAVDAGLSPHSPDKH